MQKGARAKFIADSGAGPTLDLALVQIHSDRVRTLNDWRGRVYVAATPEPLLAPMLRTVASVLVREAGF